MLEEFGTKMILQILLLRNSFSPAQLFFCKYMLSDMTYFRISFTHACSRRKKIEFQNFKFFFALLNSLASMPIYTTFRGKNIYAIRFTQFGKLI